MYCTKLNILYCTVCTLLNTMCCFRCCMDFFNVSADFLLLLPHHHPPTNVSGGNFASPSPSPSPTCHTRHLSPYSLPYNNLCLY